MGLERLLNPRIIQSAILSAALTFTTACNDDIHLSAIPDPCEPCTDSDEDSYKGGDACPTECTTDCDDANYDINTDAQEACDGIDNNCDGRIDEDQEFLDWYADSDLDGFGDLDDVINACIQPKGYILDNTDCDDTNYDINLDATEICDGIDNNCDGQIDEKLTLPRWYADIDEDGYGNINDFIEACDQPTGYVLDATDCDDANYDINPNATEICDGIDNNCDGQIDEGQSFLDWYADIDLDGHGDISDLISACSQPPGYILDNTDCDDTNSSIYPGATEICNSLDDDCDGQIDEGLVLPQWYADTDADTFGDLNNLTVACSQPLGYVATPTDCDDTNNSIYPGATEICNSLDDNCDGQIDENQSFLNWYADTDADAFGDLGDVVSACSQPPGYILNNTDCDDTNSSIYPGALEACNSLDDDCDGQVDEGVLSAWYADTDADTFGDLNNLTVACNQPVGYVIDATDCDDTNSSIYPGAIEICNSLDDDCDGQIDEGLVLPQWYADVDGDWFGNLNNSIISCLQPNDYVADATDCNDADYDINPGATEICDGIDNNCDGQIDENQTIFDWYADTDADSFGDLSDVVSACSQPPGYVFDNTDCDDSNYNVNPAATEICDGLDDDCNGIVDDTFAGCNWQTYDDFEDNYFDPNLWSVIEAICFEGGCADEPCVEENGILTCQASFTGPDDAYFLDVATLDQNGDPAFDFQAVSAIRLDLNYLLNQLGAGCAGSNLVSLSLRDEDGNLAPFYEIYNTSNSGLPVTFNGLLQLQNSFGSWSVSQDYVPIGPVDTSNLNTNQEWSLQFSADVESNSSCQESCYGIWHLETIEYQP